MISFSATWHSQSARGKSWWFLFAAAEVRKVLGHPWAQILAPFSLCHQQGGCLSPHPQLIPESAPSRWVWRWSAPALLASQKGHPWGGNILKRHGEENATLGGFWHLEFLNWLLDMRRDYCREVFPFSRKILCCILQYKAIFKRREGEGREVLKIRIILREVAKSGATAVWQDWGRGAETDFWCGIIWLKTVTITPSFTYCNECRHAARTVWEYLIHEGMNMILGAFNCWIFGVSGSFLIISIVILS